MNEDKFSLLEEVVDVDNRKGFAVVTTKAMWLTVIIVVVQHNSIPDLPTSLARLPLSCFLVAYCFHVSKFWSM